MPQQSSNHCPWRVGATGNAGNSACGMGSGIWTLVLTIIQEAVLPAEPPASLLHPIFLVCPPAILHWVNNIPAFLRAMIWILHVATVSCVEHLVPSATLGGSGNFQKCSLTGGSRLLETSLLKAVSGDYHLSPLSCSSFLSFSLSAFCLPWCE